MESHLAAGLPDDDADRLADEEPCWQEQKDNIHNGSFEPQSSRLFHRICFEMIENSTPGERGRLQLELTENPAICSPGHRRQLLAHPLLPLSVLQRGPSRTTTPIPRSAPINKKGSAGKAFRYLSENLDRWDASDCHAAKVRS